MRRVSKRKANNRGSATILVGAAILTAGVVFFASIMLRDALKDEPGSKSINHGPTLEEVAIEFATAFRLDCVRKTGSVNADYALETRPSIACESGRRFVLVCFDADGNRSEQPFSVPPASLVCVSSDQWRGSL